MQLSPLTEQLISSLRILPGVGTRSARKMAIQLLSTQRTEAGQLGNDLLTALQSVRLCNRCRMLTESSECSICSDSNRPSDAICVVQDVSDLLAIEQTGRFKGRYFVLHGLLSPLNGVGPAELGLDLLIQELQNGDVSELILAIDSSVEADATAHYIQLDVECFNHITFSRIARLGHRSSGLDQVDPETLGQAIDNRKVAQ